MPTDLERKPFTYKSLDLKSSEIRLIRLSPNLTEDGLLQCELVHRSLDDCNQTAFYRNAYDGTKDAGNDVDNLGDNVNGTDHDEDNLKHKTGALRYAALSYVWGPPEPKHQVLINNCSISIRTNLWRFLHKIRDMLDGDWAPQVDLIWLDQICIDQSNIPERNHQVGMMSSIYSLAVGTVNWLGDSPVPRGIDIDRDDYRESSEEEYQEFCRTDGSLTVGTAPKLERNEYIRIFNCICHEYWSRVWITQEIVLSQKSYVLDDHGWLNGAHLETTAHFLSYVCSHTPGDDVVEAFYNIRESADHICEVLDPTADGSKHPPPGGWSLSDVFECFMRYGNCAVACDVVYAVQGLVMPESRIKTDYSRSEGDVLDDLMDGLCVAGEGCNMTRYPENDYFALERLVSRLGTAPRWHTRIITAATRYRLRRDSTVSEGLESTERLRYLLRLGRMLCVASACTLSFDDEECEADDDAKRARISRLAPLQRVEIGFCFDGELEYLQCSHEEWLSRLDKASESEPLKLYTSQFLTEIVPSEENTYPVDYRGFKRDGLDYADILDDSYDPDDPHDPED